MSAFVRFGYAIMILWISRESHDIPEFAPLLWARESARNLPFMFSDKAGEL